MKERVFQILSQIMGTPVQNIREDSSPDTIAEWDSLKHMRLVLALEEEFSVRFSDETIVGMLNVSEILKALSAHQPQMKSFAQS
jgi:acyl carrier protein